LGALFLIIRLGLALLNRTPGGSGVEAAGRELSGEAAVSNWLEEELDTQSQIIQDNAESNVILENEAAQEDNAVSE
jgi:hypothetical protein